MTEEVVHNFVSPSTYEQTGVLTTMRNLLSWDAPNTFTHWLYEETEGDHKRIMVILATLIGQELLIPGEYGTYTFTQEVWHQPLSDFLTTSDLDSHLFSLPAPTNRLVGRTSEVRALRLLLSQNRLVTVLGMGGVGKTRLALQMAYDHVGTFQDGIYYISLVNVRGPESLLSAIIDALPVASYPYAEPRVQLLNYLRNKKLLLLLDNYEQLLPETDLLNAIIWTAPRVTILVTSRHRLGCQHESIFTLSGLSVTDNLATEPNAPGDAVDLFVQAAARFGPIREIITTDIPHIMQICRLLDGLPLAIELAASWVRLLPFEAIQTELANDLNLLATSDPNLSERHRSTKAAFDYSWRLLNPDEQYLFCQLSVFEAQFDYQAALRVTNTNLYLLRSLVDKSLVQVSSEHLLSLHPLLKDYGLEGWAFMPETQEKTREQHAAYYLELLSKLEDGLYGAEQLETLHAIAVSLDNIQLSFPVKFFEG